MGPVCARCELEMHPGLNTVGRDSLFESKSFEYQDPETVMNVSNIQCSKLLTRDV